MNAISHNTFNKFSFGAMTNKASGYFEKNIDLVIDNDLYEDIDVIKNDKNFSMDYDLDECYKPIFRVKNLHYDPNKKVKTDGVNISEFGAVTPVQAVKSYIAMLSVKNSDDLKNVLNEMKKYEGR